MSHDAHNDRLAREFFVAGVEQQLRALLPSQPPGRWTRRADAVIDGSGGQLVWTTLAPSSHAAMDWMCAADPTAIGALLDELERLRQRVHPANNTDASSA